MKKSTIKNWTKSAKQELKKLRGAQIVYNIHAGSCYIFAEIGDDVIEVCASEQEATEYIEGINEECGYNSGCYYMPIIIDNVTGERITRKNVSKYLKTP